MTLRRSLLSACLLLLLVTAIAAAQPIFIHDVQGTGAATPIPGATVTVEGVVIGNFQGSTQAAGLLPPGGGRRRRRRPGDLGGHLRLLQRLPDAGRRGAAGAGDRHGVGVLQHDRDHGEHRRLGRRHRRRQPPRPGDARPIDLPVVGVVNDFYEAREGMRVTFVDTLTVSEYFELARFGQIELFEGGRPRQFTEAIAPSVAGYAAHLDNLTRRRVILDDDEQHAERVSWRCPTAASSSIYPQANGGFSVGTQGTDFFRGGDLVNGLTGVLHWSFPGSAAPTPGASARPQATPADVHRRQSAAGDAARGGRRDQGREHEPAQLLHHDRHDREHEHRPCGPAARWTAAAPTASPSSTASASGRRS